LLRRLGTHTRLLVPLRSLISYRILSANKKKSYLLVIFSFEKESVSIRNNAAPSYFELTITTTNNKKTKTKTKILTPFFVAPFIRTELDLFYISVLQKKGYLDYKPLWLFTSVALPKDLDIEHWFLKQQIEEDLQKEEDLLIP
jgi:hypothetical protein